MNALITGGSRGIGRAIAIQLATDGYNIAINYFGNQAAAHEVVEICRDLGVKAQAYQANIANYEEAQTMMAMIKEDFESIDVLINNAGQTKDKLIMMMKSEDFDSIIDTNLKGTFNCCQLVARAMSKQKAGIIINMSSVVGITGNAGQVNYAASKAGINGLTKSLAKELGAKGVRVNAVAPGFIQTDMTQNLSEAILSQAAQAIALKRLGTLQDVADVVSFLVSDKAKYITGQIIQVDGGMVM